MTEETDPHHSRQPVPPDDIPAVLIALAEALQVKLDKMKRRAEKRDRRRLN